MTPLSVLPGRIRAENPSLTGKINYCHNLQKQIAGLDGVIEASVNHRTGRILVRFDETCLNHDSILLYFNHILNLMDSCPMEKFVPNASVFNIKGGLPIGIKYSLIDIVSHVVLPKPFNILLHIALITMKG